MNESKTRIIEFLAAAIGGNGGSLRRIDDQHVELIAEAGAEPMVCTLARDLAQQDDKLDLIGIDHPVTERLLAQWRAADPATLGATAEMGLGQSAVLGIWLVESFGTGPDKGTHLLPIAVDAGGKRVSVLEKHYRECFQAPPGQALFGVEERTGLLHDYNNPTIVQAFHLFSVMGPGRVLNTQSTLESMGWRMGKTASTNACRPHL